MHFCSPLIKLAQGCQVQKERERVNPILWFLIYLVVLFLPIFLFYHLFKSLSILMPSNFDLFLDSSNFFFSNMLGNKVCHITSKLIVIRWWWKRTIPRSFNFKPLHLFLSTGFHLNGLMISYDALVLQILLSCTNYPLRKDSLGSSKKVAFALSLQVKLDMGSLLIECFFLSLSI